MKDLTVDHLDHNKRNNSVSNLEWVTKEENLHRAQIDHLDFSSAKTIKTQFTGSGVVFKANSQIIVFKDLDDALQVVNAFVKDMEGLDAMKRKIQKSFTTGKKVYGGRWYCNG